MYDTNFTGTKNVIKDLYDGHTEYIEYTIDLTGFSSCSGYLAIGYSSSTETSSCYIKRIEYIE